MQTRIARVEQEGQLPPHNFTLPHQVISVEGHFVKHFMQHMQVHYLNSLLYSPKNLLNPQIILLKRHFDGSKYPDSAKCV